MYPRKPKLWLMFAALMTFASAVADAENGQGIISGVVRLVGAVPSLPTIRPQADFDVCGSETRRAQSLSLGASQTVGEVIVYLAGYPQNGPGNGTNNAVILDQRNCEFVPRIQIARSGAPLILRNSDAVLHVVRIDSMSGTNGPHTLLKVATPYAGYEKMYQLTNFREPTLLQITSGNGHDWMAAYIAVLPHPWVALTDGNGRFTLRNVPAGTYKIYAWHEALGTLTREVNLNGSHVATVDFEFAGKK